MGLMFISDIHGSEQYISLMIEKIEEMAPEKIILLGDALYHGPRNPLPAAYNPKAVADLLNQYKQKIIAVRGNCDSEVDQMMIEYPMMAEYSHLFIDGLTFYITHGHHLESMEGVLANGEIWVQGHTHVPVASVKGNGYFINPGSITLPKENHPRTFGWYENHRFTIYKLESEGLEVYMEVEL